MLTLHLAPLLSAIIAVALLVAGCRPGVDAGLRPSGEVRSQIEHYFLAVQSRFTEAHIQACLAERRNKGARFTPVGNPIYQPNYFYTCVANTDVHSQEFVEQKPGRYNISYEVHVPITKPATVKETNVPAGDKWFYWTRCDFAVEGEAINYRLIEKVEVFIPNVPTPGIGGSLRHICMQMPSADQYLASAQKNSVYKHVFRKPATQTATSPGIAAKQ
jgi:hypothetical protein